jgi:hypothetical protein
LKKLVILGLFAAVTVLASCGLRGGTIEVKNNLPEGGVSIKVSVKKGSQADINPSTELKDEEKKDFVYDDDGVYRVYAVYANSPPLLGENGQEVTLSGGSMETLTIP